MSKVFDSQPATVYPITTPTRRKLAVALENDEAANELVDAIDSARSVAGQILIDIGVFKRGVNAPAITDLGTSPTVPTLLFTLTNQVVSGTVLFPIDLDRTRNIFFILEFALATTQTAGDVLDIAADYIVVGHGSGNGYLKTSTHVTSSVAVSAEDGLSEGDVYHVEFELQHDDADNPLLDTEAVAFEFHMDNITDVASIHFVGACISYFDAHPGPNGAL